VFVMKKELTLIPWFGWYAAKVGAIDIDPRGPLKAHKEMVRAAKVQFARGRQVVIFPEGHRGHARRGGRLQARRRRPLPELDVPVYPVATNAGVHWPATASSAARPDRLRIPRAHPAGLKRAEFMRVLQERIEAKSNELLAL
jgi:1-acyl-sn-glycerol-3-phosphate acyltransferase